MINNEIRIYLYIGFIFFVLFCLSCSNQGEQANHLQVEENFPKKLQNQSLIDSFVLQNMKLVSGGEFYLGAVENDSLALPREYPQQKVRVDSFYIDITEVTNAQFAKFVSTTNYKTVAERSIDWEEMKKNLPPGATKPPDSLLVPGSLVFTEPNDVKNLHYLSWWKWVPGANWKHPQGPNSNIEGKENYPVVHIAYEDALAYAKWAGKRLPTEAEWTWAAKGGNINNLYPWGNEHISTNFNKANYWTGNFPSKNTKQDVYYGIAPVKSYAPNAYGLYDLAGNVWEITSDKYHEYYLQQEHAKVLVNPSGATLCYSPTNPYEKVRVMKGGSYLCNDSYCASYRISAKMAFPEKSGTNHIGFRCVVSVN